MLINREMDKHIVEYSYNEIPIKKNKPLIHATTCMNLKSMLNERRQTQKDVYCLITFI